MLVCVRFKCVLVTFNEEKPYICIFFFNWLLEEKKEISSSLVALTGQRSHSVQHFRHACISLFLSLHGPHGGCQVTANWQDATYHNIQHPPMSIFPLNAASLHYNVKIAGRQQSSSLYDIFSQIHFSVKWKNTITSSCLRDSMTRMF